MVRDVTVIIPTQDRARDLRRCLRGLADNDTSRLAEVIVIDDGSRVPAAPLSGLPGVSVRVLRLPRSIGAMPARNLAAAEVRSPIMAFLDDDAVPTADWLTVICRELSPARAAITGRVLRFDRGLLSAARQARFDSRYATLALGDPVAFFAGGNSAIWSEVFHAVGGFQSSAVGGDNSIVQALGPLGAHVAFVPELIIQHRNGKGVRRAVLDAFGFGRSHPDRLGVREGLRSIRASAATVAGERPSVRAVNWLLNAAHLIGRVGPVQRRLGAGL